MRINVNRRTTFSDVLSDGDYDVSIEVQHPDPNVDDESDYPFTLIFSGNESYLRLEDLNKLQRLIAAAKRALKE